MPEQNSTPEAGALPITFDSTQQQPYVINLEEAERSEKYFDHLLYGDPNPDIADLVALGIQKDIAALVRRGPHRPDVYVTWLGGMVTPDELRELLADQVNKGVYEPDEKERARMVRRAAWHWLVRRNEKCTLDLCNYFIIRDYGGKSRVGHWDDRGVLKLQSYEEFKKAHIEKYTIVLGDDGKHKKTPLVPQWLTDVDTDRFDRVEFLPEQEASMGVLNLWRGWPRELDYFHRIDPIYHQDCEPIGCELFLDHIYANMCGGDGNSYQYLLGWMADALQNPQRTSEVAVVLRGPQGSGKTLWAKFFMELFGRHTLTLDKPGQVTGNFNAHLMDKCIVFADEAFFAGNHQHANTLKTLITSEEIFIEPKGVDGFMAKKLLRLIIASNDDHVIRADMDDRRFLLLDVDAREHNQDRDYFSKIVAEWRDGGRRALFQWLRGDHWRMMLETKLWDVGLRPQTRGLQEQKNLSLPPAQMVGNRPAPPPYLGTEGPITLRLQRNATA
jgi:hypothetical protein